jgi:hypothetical protein
MLIFLLPQKGLSLLIWKRKFLPCRISRNRSWTPCSSSFGNRQNQRRIPKACTVPAWNHSTPYPLTPRCCQPTFSS